MNLHNRKKLSLLLLVAASACSSKEDPQPVGELVPTTIEIHSYDVNGSLDNTATVRLNYDDGKRIIKISTTNENQNTFGSETNLEYNNEGMLTKVKGTLSGRNFESTIAHKDGLIESIMTPSSTFRFSFNSENNTYTITNSSNHTLTATLDEKGNITKFVAGGGSLVYHHTYDVSKHSALTKAHPTFLLAYIIATSDLQFMYLTPNVIATAKLSAGKPINYTIQNTLEGARLKKTTWHDAASNNKSVEIEISYQ